MCGSRVRLGHVFGSKVRTLLNTLSQNSTNQYWSIIVDSVNDLNHLLMNAATVISRGRVFSISASAPSLLCRLQKKELSTKHQDRVL